MKKALLERIDLSIKSIPELVGNALAKYIKDFLDPISLGIDTVDNFANSEGAINPTTTNILQSRKAQYFAEFVYLMSYIVAIDGNSAFWILQPEAFFGVIEAVNNMNPALASDPSYR